MRKASIALCPILLWASAATAAELSTPESVAATAIKAMNARSYGEFASYMHPDALKTFRRMMTEILDAAAERKAEAELLKLFREAKSVDALKALSDRQFFTSFLEGVTGAVPMMEEALKGAEFEVLGHVKEGPTVAHVVTRMKLKVHEASIRKMSVMSLQQDGPTWKMLLTGEMEGLVTMLKARQQ